jgi:hypothetical protein
MCGGKATTFLGGCGSPPGSLPHFLPRTPESGVAVCPRASPSRHPRAARAALNLRAAAPGAAPPPPCHSAPVKWSRAGGWLGLARGRAGALLLLPSAAARQRRRAASAAQRNATQADPSLASFQRSRAAELPRPFPAAEAKRALFLISGSRSSARAMRADRAMGERGGDQRRIDLGAPLRSARRGDAPPRYKPDLKSGPVRHPGVVPFVWEQRPGQPKSVRTRRAAPPTPPREPARARPEEVGGGGGTPYHDALADLDLQALHGAADRGSRAAPASREVVAVEARKQEAVSVAAVLRKPHGDGEEEEERFSDALDTLSRTESFAMNCSVSGLSGAVEPGPGAGPEARGLMMDRFLPAAQAVAVGSPQYTFRKAGGTGNSGRDHAHAHARAAAVKASAGSGDDRMRRAPVQLPYQHLPPNYLSCAYPRREEHEEDDKEDDDDYDVHSTRGFSAKGCGLLPGLCVKTSLLLLNPIPAMKRGKAQGRGRGRQFPSRGRGQMAQSPLARSSQNKQLGCDSNGVLIIPVHIACC